MQSIPPNTQTNKLKHKRKGGAWLENCEDKMSNNNNRRLVTLAEDKMSSL